LGTGAGACAKQSPVSENAKRIETIIDISFFIVSPPSHRFFINCRKNYSIFVKVIFMLNNKTLMMNRRKIFATFEEIFPFLCGIIP